MPVVVLEPLTTEIESQQYCTLSYMLTRELQLLRHVPTFLFWVTAHRKTGCISLLTRSFPSDIGLKNTTYMATVRLIQLTSLLRPVLSLPQRPADTEVCLLAHGPSFWATELQTESLCIKSIEPPILGFGVSYFGYRAIC